MIWMSRGTRQSKIDIWTTRRKPILVRGDWRHPAGPKESKSFWLPFATLSVDIVLALCGSVPQSGECIKWKWKP